MKFGLLSQWYDPEPGGGAVPGVLSRALVARGHDVRVLTGFPNYPTGLLYKGYRQRLRHREHLAGVDVRRVPLYPSHSGRAIPRAANYASFAASAGAQASRHLSDRDALWVFNSPETVGLVATHVSKRHQVPFLLHVMDIWPDSVLDSGMVPAGRASRMALRLLETMVARTHRSAAAIAVTSPGQRELLISRGGDEERMHYIPVWADEEVFYPRKPDKSLLPSSIGADDLVLMYAGAMGHVQNLEGVVRAATMAANAGVHLVMVGSGIAEPGLRTLANELRATNVHFLGRRPPHEMGELVAAADLHLVSLADTPLLRVTMPSKVQSVMASARPIIGWCRGDAADVVRQSGAGLVPESDSPEELAEHLRTCAEDREKLRRWGRTARTYYDLHFSQGAAVTNVEQLLSRMT